MTRILCNLPLECFDDREHLGDIELITFGPPDRMWIDGAFFPFDVAFDPSRESADALLDRLGDHRRPDLVLIWWPDQEPLPSGLERCPVPVVGVISDYNLSLPAVAGLWPFFDVLLVDRAGVDLFRRLSFADVRHFCQFTFKRHHRPQAGVSRVVPIGFAGNMNPLVQPDRLPWIRRLLRLRDRGVPAEVRQGLAGPEYSRFLSSLQIGFNRSVRGEMNLRAFELPACGVCPMLERENLEVRDFFTPDEEVVLYGEDDFEDQVAGLLADPARRERIAAAAQRRVQDYSLRHRLPALLATVAGPGPGRPPAPAFAAHLGRAVAMLATWADPRQCLPDLQAAARLQPDDPRPVHAMSMAYLRIGHDEILEGVRLLDRCIAMAPRYVPAIANRVWLAEHAKIDSPVTRDDLERVMAAPLEFADVDGCALPLGFTARSIELSRALEHAVRSGRVDSGLRAVWAWSGLPATSLPATSQ